MKRSEALKLRSLVEKASASLPDKEASEGVTLFPRLKHDGALIKGGTRINWKGALKQAQADLWDTETNNPDNAPTLWRDIAYKDGYRIIPDVITVTEAFEKGERGWWKGELYESIFDGKNVYTPDEYSQGWEQVE